MKYIELYLNKREEEIKTEKQKVLEQFKSEYRACTDNDDYESLLENVFLNYYVTINDFNMNLEEIYKLRNDLIPNNVESKGE